MEGRVEPISGQDVLQAAGLADQLKLAARDLIHLAVMNRVGTGRIASADSGFDRVYGIERLDPMQVDEWRDTVTA
jgi:predicted nucleic acid-binding protein